MFAHEGTQRTDRLNRTLAAYLALIGGYVNSAGFVLLGSFTSHVTGNVGRLAGDLANHDVAAATGALAMMLAFFGGATAASVIVESDSFSQRHNAYGTALAAEAVLLSVFALITNVTPAAYLRIRDAQGLLLCAGMGMQNSLVSRLSGAVVRTTHLTGVVTDLGVEAARWLRWGRYELTRAYGVRVWFGHGAPARPSQPKVALLGTIAGFFTLGSIVGALTASSFARLAMLFPVLAITAASAYAFTTHRRLGNVAPSSPDERALP